jgi:coenzyme F420 hydrogenase subunit beta
MDIIKEKRIYDIDKLNIAFIGTPCQCRAVNKMKFLNIKPAHVVKYIISLFCFENFDYDKLMNKLNSEVKIKSNDIKKTLIKKNFFVISKDDKKFEIDIKKLNEAVRSHCLECNEFTGMFSDFSVGASGAPEGYSMIIIRTDIGARLIKSLISQNLIEPFTVPLDESNTWKSKKINWFKKMISFKQH